MTVTISNYHVQVTENAYDEIAVTHNLPCSPLFSEEARQADQKLVEACAAAWRATRKSTAWRRRQALVEAVKCSGLLPC